MSKFKVGNQVIVPPSQPRPDQQFIHPFPTQYRQGDEKFRNRKAAIISISTAHEGYYQYLVRFLHNERKDRWYYEDELRIDTVSKFNQGDIVQIKNEVEKQSYTVTGKWTYGEVWCYRLHNGLVASESNLGFGT